MVFSIETRSIQSCPWLINTQILFYEDPAHIKPMQEMFATYKDNFLPWAEHSNAMHQYFRMFILFPFFVSRLLTVASLGRP